MAGKQAKILNDEHVNDLLLFASTTRYPQRNQLIVLLSVKAGLRAAFLSAVRAATERVGAIITGTDRAGGAEVVPMSKVR